MIIIVEVDEKWIKEIQTITSHYPYNKVVLTGAGLAIFSRCPIVKTSVWSFGKNHHPRISTTIKVGNLDVHCLVIHPTTPQSESGYEERDRELAIVRNEMKAFDEPKFLVGDFNCGPWANAFDQLLRSGLLDSEQGFGPQPSWPARVGRVIENLPVPPLIPIDHLLVSKDVFVLERKAGPSIKSDHLPVFTKLEIPMKN